MDIVTGIFQSVVGFFVIVGILAFLASVGLNITGFTVMREQTKLLRFFSENLYDLAMMVKSFRKHSEALHELEQFYGDPQIKNFIEHARDMEEFLERYETMYQHFVAQEELPEDLFVIQQEESTDETHQDENA